MSKEIKYYGQCLEDQFLNDNYFKNRKNGNYIELGALDGELYSNTKFFEDNLSWKGVLIEPHPIQYNKLKINRPNNFLFNNLISNLTEDLKFKYFLEEYAGVSTIEKTMPVEHWNFYTKIFYPQAEINIKPVTLTEILKQTDIKYFDLLSLDVEGHEFNVLSSWDFSIPIEIICMETLGGSQLENEKLCHNLLLKNNYRLDSEYKHNKIYVLNK